MVTVSVVSSDAAKSSELLTTLNQEAKRWADRFVKVHQAEWSKAVGDSANVTAEIRLPLALAEAVKAREVQFRRGEFLNGEVNLADKKISFGLVWGDGEWTHDARYRKANPLDVVLKAYVRKAVDKGFGLLIHAK